MAKHATEEIRDSPTIDILKPNYMRETWAWEEPMGEGMFGTKLEVMVVLNPLADTDVQPVPPS